MWTSFAFLIKHWNIFIFTKESHFIDFQTRNGTQKTEFKLKIYEEKEKVGIKVSHQKS